VVVFTAGLAVVADEVPPFGGGSALGLAALLLDVFAVVPAAVLSSGFLLPAFFFAAGWVVLPVLLEAAAVGVGEACGWLLAPEFCAVATVAMAVASTRICISFISIPFCALFISQTLYGFAVGAGAG
jgi:sterol desaturase/sphingolipid hydroxylase (fatty acid hydroxylase superfamily)